MCIAADCLAGCDVINFEINLLVKVLINLSSEAVFSIWLKNQDNNLNTLRKK